LECWNDGILEKWVGLRLIEPMALRGYCNVGLTAIIALTTKLKMDNIPYSGGGPSFHYSIIP
jgi:hypothetical protein